MNIADYIDDYMAGQLSAADKAAFEALLKENSDARNLVKNFKAIHNLSDDILEQELLEQVKKKVYQGEVEDSKPKGSSGQKWIYLSLFLLGLFLTYFLFRRASAPEINKEELLYAFYEKPIYEDKVRSTDRNSLDLFSQGKYDFELNDFKRSEKTLRAFLKTSPNATKAAEANFWLAHALFNQEKYKAAGDLFKNSDYKNSHCLFFLTQVFQSKADRSQLSSICN